MQRGARPAGQMMATLSRPRRSALPRLLAREGVIPPETLLRLRAEACRLPVVDPCHLVADPALARRYGVGACLRDGILPVGPTDTGTTIATDDPDRFARLRPQIEAVFGPVQPVLATAEAIAASLMSSHGATLSEEAETRVAAAESCRSLGGLRIGLLFAVILGPVLLLALLAPATALAGLMMLSIATLWANTLLKAMAVTAATVDPPRTAAAPPVAADLLPVISILVPLYGEAEIAPRLVRRLERIDYPRDRLDLLLVVEADDRPTRAALERADLPDWMRIVISPAGRLRTKPRALNVALSQCRGSIIGVYDAEDAPAPDQLLKVAARFAQAGPDVACLQGILDFYNARTNLMSRAFALEYAVWFRLVLPGFERLGLVLPLGGTTLFFRRAVLEELGGWDAHNVTEDADLGLRLTRHGWRTEMLDSVTLEEANSSPLPWIKQRSRWIKGYVMTWAAHMRSPVALWRVLGTVRFLALQAQFGLSVLQALLAPFLWAFWFLHPDSLPPLAVWGAALLLVLALGLDLWMAAVAHRRAGLGFGRAWVFVLPVYHVLATLAAVKALADLVIRPFHWEKTHHGSFGG